jgi:rare lipoprotein A
MRPALNVRKSRPVRGIAGALILAIPTSAVALTVGSADAQSALQVTLNHQRISYGQSLVASGFAPRSERGHKLLLELAPGARAWRTVGSAVVHSNGHFRIVASPRQSGSVRVVPDGGSITHAGVADSTTVPESVPRHLAVAAVIHAPVDSGALGGQAVHIRGTLEPRAAGRLVTLEGGSGHGWRTLARARTRATGGFDLRYGAAGNGQVVRVHFAGDRYNGGVATRASTLTFFRQSVASWYDDGGATACGFHATYGVANKDLPCGTKVTFRYGGRTVTATVDDRGPYVGGREWDLNQNTAGALGFNGVDTVWSSR